MKRRAKDVLEVKDLEVHYGVINAIKKISFNVEEGEIVHLLVPMVQVKQVQCMPSLAY